MTTAAEPPRIDIDLFADASLRDPFADYRRLRDAGAVVRLAHPEVYAISRYGDVLKALRASDVLKSGQGVGFNDAFNAPRGNNLLQSDGEWHRKLRAVVMRPLMPDELERTRPRLKEMIAAKVAQLVGTGEFDAMKELASHLPVQAIAHLVGLEPAGRERMLEWAAATFNAIGPEQDPRDVESFKQAFAYFASLDATKVRKDSWAGHLFDTAHGGRISSGEALAAISAYVIPSLDTTVLAKGHLLANLARDPHQWQLLRERPDLIPSTVLEGVRHSSVIRWFARVAEQDYRVADWTIPAGARVMLLYGAANRDERHYPDPDRFDVTRNARDHLAWGRGEHMCAGMHLARIEMEVMLEALIESGSTLHPGAPVLGTNKGLFGFTALPFELKRNLA